MKQYIILLLIILSSSYCNSQTTEPQRIITFAEKLSDNFIHQNGDYYIDNENKLNTFEGIWIYNDGNGTILTVNLRKKNQLLLQGLNNQYKFSDFLVLTYKLEKNNVVLHNNLNDALPSEMLSIYNDFFGYFTFYQPNYLETEGSFFDKTYNIIASCAITKLPTLVGQSEKINIHLYSASRKNDPSFYTNLPSVFSVPNNVELTKL
jgi:hypothetical protein